VRKPHIPKALAMWQHLNAVVTRSRTKRNVRFGSAVGVTDCPCGVAVPQDVARAANPTGATSHRLRILMSLEVGSWGPTE
jgi:hypothetical protein